MNNHQAKNLKKRNKQRRRREGKGQKIKIMGGREGAEKEVEGEWRKMRRKSRRERRGREAGVFERMWRNVGSRW